ncbi:hypothetical protein DEU56DRAFT_758145 [Suillus clintonianus]|uniref:uncharacterized protein n=1 Tax=Suillus clintonianus TaxID=1904413 RepID=UPI001B86EEDE|nr:uncharacterized protein DEU56DRAFT_758145 [Suillus clintonianus]KAG2129444.1 hypothetical protein DEU56DRAFT_758145 [Suillus clintonianus]
MEGLQISIWVPGKTLEAHFAEEKYPFFFYESERDVAFPGRESVEDLVRRGERAVREVVLPHVGPMVNTGWVRVEVQIQGGIPVEIGDGEVPPVEVIVTDEGRADHLEGLLDRGPLQGMKAIMGGGVVMEGKNPNEAEAISQTSAGNSV